MKITIEFDTDNADFEFDFLSEVYAVLVSRAYAAIARQGDAPGDSEPLRDSNGNTIGEVRFS